MPKKKTTKKVALEGKVIDQSAPQAESNTQPAAYLDDESQNSKRQPAAVLENEGSAQDTQLGLILGGVQITLPETIEERMQLATVERNQSAIHVARAGYFLLSVKENCDHGRFKEELDRAKWPERDARDCMAIAKMLLKHGPEIQNKLTKITKTNLIQLTRLEPETIEELAETEELDEFSTMSKRELAEEIKVLKRDAQTLADRLTLEQKERSELKKPHKFGEEVVRIREESNYYAEQVGFSADQMQMLMLDIQRGDWQLSFKDGREDDEIRIASQTLYLNIVDGYRRFKYLVEEFLNSGMVDIDIERPDELEPLDDAELSKLRTMTQVLKRTQEAKKRDRHVERTNAARSGQRGRPLKAKKS